MKRIVFVLSMLLVLLTAVSASADTITYPISVPNLALSPHPGPYANVLVDLTDSTYATITMTALSTFAIGGGRAFDLNPNGPVTWSGLTSGFSEDTGSNRNVSEFGDFILIFNAGNGFSNPYFSVSVTLGLTSGTWANASYILLPNIDGFALAAHIGVPGATGGYPVTGYAGNGPPIPELSTMFLLGSGLIGLVGYGSRKFFKK
jgi:hypothetical protein